MPEIHGMPSSLLSRNPIFELRNCMKTINTGLKHAGEVTELAGKADMLKNKRLRMFEIF